MSCCSYDADSASLPFSPSREHTGDGEPQPLSQAAELKSTLALRPFWVQFMSATNRGPSIVTEVEIQAWDAPARRGSLADRAPNASCVFLTGRRSGER
jgi:hypothetical protein